MPFCFHIIIKEFCIISAFFRWLVSFPSENTSETYCHMNTGFVRKLAILSVNCLLLGIFAPAFLTATRPALPFLAIYWCWQLCFLRDYTTFSRIIPQRVPKMRWLPSDCDSDRPSFLIKMQPLHLSSKSSYLFYISRNFSKNLAARLHARETQHYSAYIAEKSACGGFAAKKTSRSKPCLLAGHAAAT